MTVSMQRVSGSIVPLSMIDTGGIDDVDAPFMEQIKHQAEIAMEEADVIVLSCLVRKELLMQTNT